MIAVLPLLVIPQFGTLPNTPFLLCSNVHFTNSPLQGLGNLIAKPLFRSILHFTSLISHLLAAFIPSPFPRTRHLVKSKEVPPSISIPAEPPFRITTSSHVPFFFPAGPDICTTGPTLPSLSIMLCTISTFPFPITDNIGWNGTCPLANFGRRNVIPSIHPPLPVHFTEPAISMTTFVGLSSSPTIRNGLSIIIPGSFTQ
mmetsp:Transcript_28134/g.68417  ORF Transcript_28134/g.68417 Transcript_28134/m.68417 type:complete len:200 (-) Transcript_28134:3853-4452(-)